MYRHVISTGCTIAFLVVSALEFDGLAVDADLAAVKQIKASDWTVPGIDLAMRRVLAVLSAVSAANA